MAEVSKWDEIRRHMNRSLKQGWKLYSQSKYGIVGLALILIFAIMAIFAPFLTPYSPQFEAPSIDALRPYVYAFNTTAPVEDMAIGYTQLTTAPSEGGNWIILNYGKSIHGIFIQDPSRVGMPNKDPWGTNSLRFTLNLTDVPGIGAGETITNIAFLAPSTSDLQYHYSGTGQDPNWDGELVFTTQHHLVIYDIYNLKPKSNYDRVIVKTLPYTPTWLVVDTTSSGNLEVPVVYAPGSAVFPSRFIGVGDEYHATLYWYYYTYSNDSYLPNAQQCLYPVLNQNYTEKIIMKPLLFYNDYLYSDNPSKDQNVFIVPLETKTIVYKGFDTHTYPTPFPTPGVLPFVPRPNVVETVLDFPLTAEPGYYAGSPNLGKNYIFLPAQDNGNAVVYVMNPVGSNGHVVVENDWTMNMGRGMVTAPPSVTYAGGNFTVFNAKYVNNEDMSYIYEYMKGTNTKFEMVPINSTKNGAIPVNSKVVMLVNMILKNGEMLALSKGNELTLYVLDFADYQTTGKMIVSKFMYYNNYTKKLSPFPYPPGSKLSYFEYMGTLSGSRYSATASSNVYTLYYCNDTKTVGLLNPKGINVLPLPPGRYFSGNWYILGTDDKGHDIWTWLVYGARVAFIVGILAAFFSVMIGTLYGIYSGYKGGVVDTLLMRFVDIMLTLPGLPILLILTAILGPSIWNIILVISALGWSGIARVIRAQTLSLRSRPFVDAARVAGASNTRIMVSHIFPNVLPYSFLYMTLGVAGAILSEAALSFLGLGDPKAISWGQMLYSIQTAGAVMYAWWWLLPPGLSITLISLGFYLVGRAFDEILNPRLRKR